MAIIDELVAILGFDLQNEEDAKRFDKRLNEIGVSLNKVAKKAAKFAAITSGAMATGFTAFGRSVVTTSAQFETFAATLETIEGSAEKAQQSLDWIAEFGKTTPYDVEQVTAAFVKLKAFGIDPVADDALRTLGDTGAAMGKSLDQAVEAFADAATGEFERLKEFGIKASTQGKEVTFAWTQNGKELTKTVKKNSTEIRAFLLQTMGDRFAGAMDRQSRTWRGMMSNLGDTWVDFKRRVGETGFFDSISNQLERLLAWLGELDADGTLDRWAKNLSDALTFSANLVETVATQIGRHLAFLAENFDTLKPFVYGLGIALGVLIAAAFPLISIFTAIAIAVDDFLTFLQGGESFIGDFVNALKGLVDGAKELGKRMGQALFDGLVQIGEDIKAWFASLVPDWMRGLGDQSRLGTTRPQPSSGSNPARNLSSNTNRIRGSAGARANISDRRQQNMTQTVNIEQNVQQATDAPGAVADATGRAAIAAARKQRTQSESEPSF